MKLSCRQPACVGDRTSRNNHGRHVVLCHNMPSRFTGLTVLCCVMLQGARLALVAERLENLRTEYLSFLYGFQAVGGNAVPTDLSNDEAGLFKTADLANIFFRCVEGVLPQGASAVTPHDDASSVQTLRPDAAAASYVAQAACQPGLFVCGPSRCLVFQCWAPSAPMTSIR